MRLKETPFSICPSAPAGSGSRSALWLGFLVGSNPSRSRHGVTILTCCRVQAISVWFGYLLPRVFASGVDGGLSLVSLWSPSPEVSSGLGQPRGADRRLPNSPALGQSAPGVWVFTFPNASSWGFGATVVPGSADALCPPTLPCFVGAGPLRWGLSV